ncbi:MAG: Ribonuclease R [Caldanaerobacter subterraneus]|uniref:Ribonuclease R n=2 Tax=Caldanaerobacter subterraneus TaxID=911092 RepID=Q8RB41_CALS4|nr:ribonuclease R [Caldanaerobacter subterraneus]AAM24238.1 Exoribonucleases [Caldanaerobacter subterraneus subsp. tengcongensis MB4]KUK09231.1 MAG: Ribonuclease R [Caldanaerobacter subterraneus]MBE3579751.1 ribonuclease R [Caldanaerobacter subterraneus]MCS3916234.1 ribonuclease R [Caldanaerobacter subterraneus subsp. tengcongensis MB4]TCO63893.1 RNAse R [Caldanaerobacter subterraneus]
MKIKERLLQLLREEDYKPSKIEEIMDMLHIDYNQRKILEATLKEMEKEGLVFKTKRGKYALPERLGLVRGRIDGHPRGYGFLIPEEQGIKDIFIPISGMNGAMDGDLVLVRVIEGAEGKSQEGEVVKILKRANTTIVGTYEKNKNFGFVIPDNKKIHQDVFIPKGEDKGAKTGMKVVVRITKWPEGRRSPEGEIIEVLGYKGDPGIDVKSILRSYDIPETFPKEVLKEAEELPEEIPEKEKKRRVDLTKLKFVTIDGEDAKDLDDAVYVERLPNGNYLLYVSIADVSHYVKEGTNLDKEALRRGCSVYFLDRVIPMLPPKLSNGICSLNPGEERLSLTVKMEINTRGEIVDHDIFESIIESKERMTYTSVYKILEENDEELIKRYSHLVEDFKLMKELALVLLEKRKRRGSVDFDFPEAKVIVDEKGRPVDIVKVERNIAHKIIEEFMLAANETVAEHMHWLNVPFVYRIHEHPDIEKLLAFNKFIHNLGYHIKGVEGGEIHPKALQDLIRQVRGKSEQKVVETLLLRSLKRARYSPEDIGHYALAAKYYTHFTSPIRRYPDLVIHRIIKEYINGKLTEKRQRHYNRILEDIAARASERERAAEAAEREIEELKKVEYMADKVGNVYKGIISNVTSYGFFVELDNTVEGLVDVASLEDDYYVFDPERYVLVGERTKKVYSIGKEVYVKVAHVDVDNREIDFVLVEEDS